MNTKSLNGKQLVEVKLFKGINQSFKQLRIHSMRIFYETTHMFQEWKLFGKDRNSQLSVYIIFGNGNYARTKNVRNPRVGKGGKPIAELTKMGWFLTSLERITIVTNCCPLKAITKVCAEWTSWICWCDWEWPGNNTHRVQRPTSSWQSGLVRNRFALAWKSSRIARQQAR